MEGPCPAGNHAPRRTLSRGVPAEGFEVLIKDEEFEDLDSAKRFECLLRTEGPKVKTMTKSSKGDTRTKKKRRERKGTPTKEKQKTTDTHAPTTAQTHMHVHKCKHASANAHVHARNRPSRLGPLCPFRYVPIHSSLPIHTVLPVLLV